MALKSTPICNFGEKAHDFSLKDLHGKWLNLDQCRGPHGLLVMFISNHCPYVQAIRKKLVRDTAELIEAGIGCVAIMPNDQLNYPDDSVANMKRVAEQFAFPFPYLVDDTQQVAREYGAVCTPDFFGYNANLELQYRGRLDASGAKPDADDQPRELFEAMKLVADTGHGPREQIASIGCSIKWKH